MDKRIKQKLGDYLKDCRSLSNMTLREVEDCTGVSNAYLSQLENNKIKKPSANVLYKLASLYKVELDTVLFHAGIIPQAPSKIISPIWTHIITTEEEAALLDYLKYLRHKNKKS